MRPEDTTNSMTIKAFLYNKRRRFEHELGQIGIDRRKDEVKMLIKKITESENEMYDNWAPMLVEEAIDSYIIGHFNATIALSGMAAERFLYDFFDFVDIKTG